MARGQGRSLFPAKGTKARGALLLAMRKCGVTYEELTGQLGMSYGTAGHLMNAYAIDRGWDIRSFPLSQDDKSRRVLRLVGFDRLDGTYYSLVAPPENLPLSKHNTQEQHNG